MQSSSRKTFSQIVKGEQIQALVLEEKEEELVEEEGVCKNAVEVMRADSPGEQEEVVEGAAYGDVEVEEAVTLLMLGNMK